MPTIPRNGDLQRQSKNKSKDLPAISSNICKFLFLNQISKHPGSILIKAQDGKKGQINTTSSCYCKVYHRRNRNPKIGQEQFNIYNLFPQSVYKCQQKSNALHIIYVRNILSRNKYLMIIPKPSSTYLMFLPTSSQQQLEYYKNMPQFHIYL